MNKLLHVLLVEDSEDDALLLLHDLHRGGYEVQFERVETPTEMELALKSQTWDIVISDYSLPYFNAPFALHVLKETGLDLPFIIVSGTIGEDAAITALKAGAHDFIVKGSTARLIPAIERELGEAENRRKQRQAEIALLQSEKRYRRMFEENQAVQLIINSETWAIVDANPAACEFYNYSLETLQSMSLIDISIPPHGTLLEQMSHVLNGKTKRVSIVSRQRLGSAESRDVEIYPSPIEIDGQLLVYCIIHDITRRKKAEEELQQKKAEFEAIFQSNPDATLFTDLDHHILMMNPAFALLFGYQWNDLKGKPLRMLYNEWADYDEQSKENFNKPREKPYEILYRKKDGSTFISNNVDNVVKDSDGNSLGLLRIIRDITEHKQAEETLRQYAHRLKTLHEIDRGILSDQNPEDIAQHVLDFVMQNMPIQEASVMTFDLHHAEGIILATSSLDDLVWSPGAHFHLNQFLTEDIEVLRQGKIQVVEDVSTLSTLPSSIFAMYERGLRSYVIMPLIVQEELIGSFSLGSNQTSAFSLTQIDIIREIADQIAIAIYQANLHQKIRQHASELEQHVLERTQELQQTKETVESILNSSDDAIALASFDGVIQQVNPAFSRLLEYAPQQALGMSLISFVTTESIEIMFDAMYGVINSYLSQSIEIIARRQDYQVFDGDAVLSPVLDNGRIIDMVLSLRDVSERKRIERALQVSEEQYRTLVEFAPDPIVVVNSSGYITLANHSVRSVFGYESSELIGQAIELLVPDNLHDIHRSHRSDYIIDPIPRPMGENQDIYLKHKNGSLLSVEIRLSPVQTSEDTLVMAYIIDVSAHKELETNLRSALDTEKELNELKTNFISMVSHDFRTPLTVIQTSIDILKSYNDKMDDARRANHFNKIRLQIERMVALLEDVLTINQADAGAMPFSPTSIDLDRFCRGMIEDFQNVSTMKHILNYTYREDPQRVLVDEKLLQQALINLLTNAFKYSPAGSTVDLELSFESKYAIIRVKDQGIGIPEEDQLHLFEIFHRAGNVGAIQGTGLGLAIVKRSVEAHRGSISFESQIDVGTTFTIKLPIDQAIQKSNI